MHPIRILLADDNDEVLAAVREELGAEFEIIGTVTNGQDAVEAVRLFNPDVVVMDIAMPVFDGIEAAERIRKINAHTKFFSSLSRKRMNERMHQQEQETRSRPVNSDSSTEA